MNISANVGGSSSGGSLKRPGEKLELAVSKKAKKVSEKLSAEASKKVGGSDVGAASLAPFYQENLAALTTTGVGNANVVISSTDAGNLPPTIFFDMQGNKTVGGLRITAFFDPVIDSLLAVSNLDKYPAAKVLIEALQHNDASGNTPIGVGIYNSADIDKLLELYFKLHSEDNVANINSALLGVEKAHARGRDNALEESLEIIKRKVVDYLSPLKNVDKAYEELRNMLKQTMLNADNAFNGEMKGEDIFSNEIEYCKAFLKHAKFIVDIINKFEPKGDATIGYLIKSDGDFRNVVKNFRDRLEQGLDVVDAKPLLDVFDLACKSQGLGGAIGEASHLNIETSTQHTSESDSGSDPNPLLNASSEDEKAAASGLVDLLNMKDAAQVLSLVFKRVKENERTIITTKRMSTDISFPAALGKDEKFKTAVNCFNAVDFVSFDEEALKQIPNGTIIMLPEGISENEYCFFKLTVFTDQSGKKKLRYKPKTGKEETYDLEYYKTEAFKLLTESELTNLELKVLI